MLRTALRGYDRRSVDAFLLRCASSLGPRAAQFPELAALAVPDRPPPALDAGDVRAARFPLGLRGYELAGVDALLARIADALPAEDARPRWAEGEDDPAVAPALGPALRRVLRGYDTDQVDAFLVRCAHTLGTRVEGVPELAPLLSTPRTGAPVRPRDVEVVQFHVRVHGYDIDQVDTLLDRVAAALTAQA